MLRDRLGSECCEANLNQKAPFPRILSENSSSTLPALRRRPAWGVGTLIQAGLPQGRLCRQPADAAQGTQGLRTDTDCSGNWFGDTLAHRVMIQAPQPWLLSGLEKHKGSPAPTGLAPSQQSLKRTWDFRTGSFFSRRSQHAGTLSHSSVTGLIRPTKGRSAVWPFTG